MATTTEFPSQPNFPLSDSREVSEIMSQVNIPSDLVRRVSARLSESDFHSVDDYVSYLVALVLDELEASQAQEKSDDVFSKEDQQNVEQRLRNLGYM
jgi:Arc/MetJ-type ribon-helix-helix transcriptional regulator